MPTPAMAYHSWTHEPSQRRATADVDTTRTSAKLSRFGIGMSAGVAGIGWVAEAIGVSSLKTVVLLPPTYVSEQSVQWLKSRVNITNRQPHCAVRRGRASGIVRSQAEPGTEVEALFDMMR